MRPAHPLIVAVLTLGVLATPGVADPGFVSGDEFPPPKLDASNAQRARAEKTTARVARRLHVSGRQSLYLRRAYVFEKQLFASYGLRYRGVRVEQSSVLVRLPADGGFEIRQHKHVPLPARLRIDARPKISARAARKAILALDPRAEGEPELVIRLIVTRTLGDPGEGRSYWTSDDVIETATGYQLLYRVGAHYPRYVVDARTGVATDTRKPDHRRRRDD